MTATKTREIPPHQVRPSEYEGHAVEKKVRLSDQAFVDYVKSLPPATLRRKMSGPNSAAFKSELDTALKNLRGES